MTAPEELMEVLRGLELAADAAGRSYAGLRSEVDESLARLRDAGMAPEQRGGLVMASLVISELEANPIIYNLLKEDLLQVVVSALVALK